MTLQQQLDSGLSHHQAGRLAEAERIYRQVLAQQPNHADALHLLGVLAVQTGQPAVAVELIRQAIAICSTNVLYYGNLGKALEHLGRFDEAIAACRQAIQIKPDYAEAHYNLGVVLQINGQLDDAIASYRLAIRFKPDYAEAHYNLGNLLQINGQLEETIAAYRQAISVKPDHVGAHFNLGNALHAKGQLDEAIAAHRQAIQIKPDLAGAHVNLGNALKKKGRLDEAIASYRQAIQFKPDFADAHSNLGNALWDRGRLDEAIAACRQAIALKPDLAEAYGNLGNALMDKGQVDEAVAAHRQTIRLKPDYAEAHNNLGNALNAKGQFDDAIASLRRALRLKPDYAEAHLNLGNALRDKGQLDEAIASYRQAIRLKPQDAAAHSGLVYTLHFHPGYDAQAILAEHRQWAAVHAEPLRSEIAAHLNDRSPERKLKIAFLSPDLTGHPVGRSLLPLLENRDRRQFEIVCYADMRSGDLVTAKLKSLADQWHEVVAMNDREVAETIRRDRIDILVDTTLHTAHNRLLVFAREPAPVQLTMLGPPITTGLATMHYRLTDPYLDPPETGDGDYCETSIRLPHCFWIYQPPASAALPNDLPARSKGFVTFGCLNQFSKVTRPALELWLGILQSVPNSRLMIQSQPGEHLDPVRKLFHDGGIATERLQFVAKTSQEEYFRRYHQLDICLDPFPFNGHTSSMDGLWMGVPTVTLRGRTAVGRGGVSILSNVGLTDWIADDPERYVEIAEQKAGDLPRLGELRSTLRGRMQSSPLMDAPGFARDVESAFRQMWRNWCEHSGGSK